MLIHTTLLLLAALPSGVAPGAQQTPTEVRPVTDDSAEGLDAEIDAVLAEFSEARQAFGVAYREAETPEERERIVEELYPDGEAYCGRLMELVARDPADPAAPRALAWVLQQTSDDEHIARASELFLAHHLDSEEIGAACAVYERQPTGGRAFLEAVAERSTAPAAAAQARFSLAMHLLERASVAERLAALPEDERGGFLSYYGEATVAALAEVDPGALKAEAEALFEHVAEVGGEVERRGGTLADACARQLFELRNLQVGMVAPDIEGEDLDGVAFKLSDYRGKVVVLDFWGNW